MSRCASAPRRRDCVQFIEDATFFVVAALLAIPGLVLLQRVAPIQQRDLPDAELPPA